MTMPTTQCQARSKGAGILTQNHLMPYLYPSWNPRSDTAIHTKDKVRWVCESRTKKITRELSCAFIRNGDVASICCLKSVILGSTAQGKQNMISHQKGSGLRCQSRSSSPCLDYFHEKQVTQFRWFSAYPAFIICHFSTLAQARNGWR